MSKELRDMQLFACKSRLQTDLDTCGLPPAAKSNLRKQFDGKVFEPSELQAAISGMKTMVDELAIAGHGRARVGVESVEKLQAAIDQMFGVKVADNLKGYKGLTSLRAAYTEMTGDTDVNGAITPENSRRLQAAYGDTTFAHALGNTLYRRVVQDYREISDFGVSRLVGRNIRNAKDFRDMQSILVGYYGDLPTVNTDDDDYPDLGEVSDDKVEYALAEKGGIITIKRRTLINDDVELIKKIISRIGRGARRGLARTVWAPFINNSVWKGDNKAIFHEDHGNIGTSAYGITAALAAKTCMYRQVEPGSAEKLALRPVTVAHPSELYGLVKNVNDFNPQAVEIEAGNAMYGFFKPEGLYENPFMVDANDWMMFADPDEIEIVELAFLNGQQEPQVTLANTVNSGQMFLNGSLQYKISHDYEAVVTDFRGAFKSVVAP